MNQPAEPSLLSPMPDVQGHRDVRNLPIDRVGVRRLRHPVLLRAGQGKKPLPSVAVFSLSVALPADQKGTHMSRFVALLETMSRDGVELSADSAQSMAREMLRLLEAPEGTLALEAPYFLEKAAPVSGVKSLMDYTVGFEATAGGDSPDTILMVKVPVKSLCPCSKEISDYGAHNQRSEVTVRVRLGPQPAKLCVGGLIRAVEAQASCELWGLLKRPDEKYVTERAYDNAKFVEDLVRDVAIAVRALPGVIGYEVEAENFESIHNHSAWARLSA